MDIPVARRTHQMIRPNRQSQRLVALFLLGCLMFNYPLMYVFSVDVTCRLRAARFVFCLIRLIADL